MSEIEHTITIKAKPETIYQALSTANGLTSWFTSHVNGSGMVGTNWDLSFTNEPFFSWHITSAINPNQVAWECIEGPGNAAGTEVEFDIQATANNQAILTIIHRGWTEDDPKFERCIEIWRTLMDHLQQYCESGVKKPAYH